MTEQRPIGAMYDFDVRPFLEAAGQLCVADEYYRALQLINNLPAFYRDNEPSEVTEMRQAIWRGLMTAQDYMLNVKDDMIDAVRAKGIVTSTLRGLTVLQDIQRFNKDNLVPHLIDMGPGEFWLSIGLKEMGCKFTYQSFSLHPDVAKKAKDVLGEEIWRQENVTRGQQPILFNACEIIEHLVDTTEIFQVYCKAGGYADLMYMSTPLYTYGLGTPDWWELKYKGQLGHVRAYTPKEFGAEASRLFPTHNIGLKISNDGIMFVRGVHPASGLE